MGGEEEVGAGQATWLGLAYPKGLRPEVLWAAHPSPSSHLATPSPPPHSRSPPLPAFHIGKEMGSLSKGLQGRKVSRKERTRFSRRGRVGRDSRGSCIACSPIPVPLLLAGWPMAS